MHALAYGCTSPSDTYHFARRFGSAHRRDGLQRSQRGLLDALARRGVACPGQLPVTGYDSTLARLAHVDLTSVSQDAREQACRAVALATGRLEGGGLRRARRYFARGWWSAAALPHQRG